MEKFLLLFLAIINIPNVVLSDASDGTLNNNINEKLMMKLIEKLDILERKITKLEKNELQMKESIRALIETNAKLRMENLQLDQRVENVETELNPKRETVDDKMENHECTRHEKRQISPPAEKIAFTSYLDHPIKTLQKDQAIIYNQVLLNDGNGYDSTTGIFTAPVGGVYLFSWAATARKLPGEHAYDIWVKLQVNGAHQAGCVAESQGDADDNQGSNTVLFRVNQGDQVWTAHYSSFPDIYGDDNERTTSFSGVLLYEDL